MNRKITVIVLILAVAMLATPIVSALPWDPKNNEDKFQTFSTSFSMNLASYLAAVANPEYIPSEDNPNKVITSWIDDSPPFYEITVGSNTYYLGTDFEYTSAAVFTAIGAPFTPIPDLLGLIVGSKQQKFRVDYMYDFSAVEGGIDGTLEMLAITAKDGVMHIRSLRGTGDLQNVQIQATAGIGFSHIGVVSGWPE